MANYNDGACEDLDTFSNIRYTPAWYYKKWPGFLNVESYKILANWDKGVRTEEEWARDQGMEEGKLCEMQEEEEVLLDIYTDTEFDTKDQNKKKRKQMTVILEEGGTQPPYN